MKIIACSYPNKIANKARDMFEGFPGLLTVLAANVHDDINYLVDYHDLANVDDYDLIVIEFFLDPFVDQQFMTMLDDLDRSRIVVGGPCPTIYTNRYAAYFERVVVDHCSDLPATLAQSGTVVRGLNQYEHLPRYDLYDYVGLKSRHNLPIFSYGTLMSSECCNSCNFCTNSTVNNLLCGCSKPMDYFEREVKLMHDLYGTQPLGTMNDANFLIGDFEQKLHILSKHNFAERYYLLASLNMINDKHVVDVLKKYNATLINVGLEEIDVNYQKNANIDDVFGYMESRGVYLTMNVIYNQVKVHSLAMAKVYVAKTKKLLATYNPVVVSFNFMMFYPGTRLFTSLDARRQAVYGNFCTHTGGTVEVDLLNLELNNRAAAEEIVTYINTEMREYMLVDNVHKDDSFYIASEDVYRSGAFL